LESEKERERKDEEFENSQVVSARSTRRVTFGKGEKGKAIPVTGCETSRHPHFLDNRLTDGVKVVSLRRRSAAFYPQESSWYSFLLEAGTTQGHSEAGRINSF
jgi:hypothetical protein